MLVWGVKYVNYLGPKYGKDKQQCFANADIFVFPTYYANECFPLVLLEAMQYKLPIVTTNEGGIPDVVRDGVNGFVCERKDISSLVYALEKLLKDKESRVQMGLQGYKLYQAQFAIGVFEKNMRNSLKKMNL